VEASELIATLTLFDTNQREIFGKIWRVDASQGKSNQPCIHTESGSLNKTRFWNLQIPTKASSFAQDVKNVFFFLN
jgi:hypothetical protein